MAPLRVVLLLAAASIACGAEEAKLESCVASFKRSLKSQFFVLGSPGYAVSPAAWLGDDAGTGGGRNTGGDPIDGLIQKLIVDCLNVTQTMPQRSLRLMVPKSAVKALLRQRAADFQEQHGIQVVLNEVNYWEVGKEAVEEVQDGLSGFYDGWVMDPAATGEVAALDGFTDLNAFIPEDEPLQWSDYSRFFRLVSGIYDQMVYGLPLDGDLFLMYYRRDLFSRYNLSVPVTWSDFVDLATAMNGTDTDGDGAPDLYGACFDAGDPQMCKGAFLLAAVVAPYLQYLGTSQGVFFDPAGMTPLVNNPAMERALEHWAQLFRIGSKVRTCDASNALFASGRCLMTINWGDEFKANAHLGGNRTVSTLGVSRLPGAEVVLNRRTNRLEPCNGTDMCPYAERVTLRDGRRAWVTFAPYSAFGGWTGTVNRRTSPTYQKYAYQFFSSVVQPNSSWAAVLDPATTIDPYRRSQLDVSGPGFARWTGAGYDAEATRMYLAAINAALENQNMVLDIRLKSAPPHYRNMYGYGADNVTWNAANWTIRQVMANMEAGMLTSLQAAGGAAVLQPQYCRQIGCTLDSEGQSGHGATMVVCVVIAAAIATVLLVAAATVLALRHRMRGHRHLLRGGVIAPKAGAATSLMITDIQDSTSVWEALPEDVMDAALRCHHAVVRKGAARFAGYESATEGDSFILAFHTAADAVACAVWIQQELLAAPWPKPLLDAAEVCPSVREQIMVPGPQHAALLALLGMEDGPGGPALAAVAAKEGLPGSNADPYTNAPHALPVPHKDGPTPSHVPPPRRTPVSYEGLPSSCANGSISSMPSGPIHPLSSPLPSMGFSSSGLATAAPPAATSLAHYVQHAWLPPQPGVTVTWANNTGPPRRTPQQHLQQQPCLIYGRASDPGVAAAGAEGAAVSAGNTSLTHPTTHPAAPYNTPGALLHLKDSRIGRGGDAGAAAVVFRGLRVRMGVHSGVPSDHDVTYNAAEARYHYAGQAMTLARALGGVAAGGQVLLSDAAFAQLRGAPGASKKVASDALMVLHMGLHDISDYVQPQQVYQALSLQLLPRLALLPPIRDRRCLAAGALSAPVGSVAISFMHVVGASILLSWDVAVARQALALFEETAAAAVMGCRAGGYMVEATNGLVLAAFADAADAIRACLEITGAMPDLDWDPALLEHELCEEVSVTVRLDARGNAEKHTMFRGLRVKAGVDHGSARACVNGATGRVAYRGRVMNRAARIAGMAGSGEVLASMEAWQAAAPAIALHDLNVSAISRGLQPLRGITEPVKVVECFQPPPPTDAAGGASRPRSFIFPAVDGPAVAARSNSVNVPVGGALSGHQPRLLGDRSAALLAAKAAAKPRAELVASSSSVV